ncbi:tautomerase family protein [Flexivirga oryzae]|uniref:4-oxalocrotonate tautomerase family enzyme n=1 Tax=Flexivirga oryzae TaxID=1794944 RepID=A0A839NAW9_9MICO|nr:tautomerase family protein [Flexivirga oryzae]MBB2893373.1 4-oxalocrotonate tautomerase family enzyme [Flexivirga oryzae]
MPIAHFHVPAATFDAEQERELLERASATYSRVLDSPIERVRAFLVHYPASSIAVGGIVDNDSPAPYFTAIVLAGRSVEQRHELLTALTDDIVDTLGVDVSGVRGQIIEVSPDNWGIAGRPASGVRATEIADRAASATA